LAGDTLQVKVAVETGLQKLMFVDEPEQIVGELLVKEMVGTGFTLKEMLG
jgi:hypothetical protein